MAAETRVTPALDPLPRTAGARLPAAPPHWKQLLPVALGVVGWLALTAWARLLTLPDEGRYVGVAWEMLRSGDWLTPTLNGLPYFHKPPLFYWITASALSVFGPNEWAGRAAPVFGAALGALATYLFVRRWWGERASRLALLALLTQPLYFIGGQFANLDMLVAGCITATILLCADAALCIEQRLPFRTALGAAFAMAAFGVLAKGLIGLVLPVLVIATWLLLQRRWRNLVTLCWWPGMLLFLVIAAPWFIAMQSRFPEFLDYFFVVQHFKRFAEAGFNNARPFWFYPAALLLLSLPWLPWLTRPLRRGFLADPERRPIRLLLLVWLVVVVGFFSLPRSKLLGYVLPCVPALAMLMADAYLVAGATRPGRTRRVWRASAAVAVLIGLGAVIAIAVYPLRSSKPFALAIAGQPGAEAPTVMLNEYYFDLPFYAQLHNPVAVVDDWASPEVALRDNWRKELADAGRFAPRQASVALIAPIALDDRLCAAPLTWVIGPGDAAARYPLLAAAAVALERKGTTLWRVERDSPRVADLLRCASAPPRLP